jgi:signal transduction histidine kinase
MTNPQQLVCGRAGRTTSGGRRGSLRNIPNAFFGCRICWRVTAITFLAILVVEGIILIPSYWNYERDRLLALSAVGRTAAHGMLLTAVSEQADAQRLQDAAEEWFDRSDVVGARLVGPAGEQITAGEPVSLNQASIPLHRIDGGSRYEAGWDLRGGDGTWLVLVRMQADQVGQDLRAFVLRILGLVLLIACAVTVATMAVLARTVLRPVLALRDAMCLAARSPEDAEDRVLPVRRRDEIAEMTMAFNDLARNTSRNLRELHAGADDLARARAEAERANAAKSSFLASMSHELRTPLNAILGFSDVLKAEMFGPLGTDKYRDYAKDIHSSGAHLLALINDILDLSKAEAGRLDLREEWESLPDIAENAMRMVERRAEDKQIRLVSEVPPLFAHVDAGRLKQVLLNLLSNALKFTPRGGAVSLVAVMRPDHLAIQVRDSGTGIAPEIIETLFEPFTQAENHTDETAAESTGLGLPISRQIIELHGGSLTLTSEPGEGTTAIILLPATKARDHGSTS